MQYWKIPSSLLTAGVFLCLIVHNSYAVELNATSALNKNPAPDTLNFSDQPTHAADPTHSSQLDRLIEAAMKALLSANWVEAEQYAQQLVDAFPDYALGHLVLAEIHSIKAGAKPLLTSLPTYTQSVIDLLLEAQTRSQQSFSVTTDETDFSQQLPATLLQIGEHIDHVVLVDLDSSYLYLFNTENEHPRVLRKHYVSSGKGGYGKQIEGDMKTPLGVYRIHGFRSDESLPPLYGSGALMLDYPNTLDRALGRTGSGIWLHGNPRSNRSRSPHSSEGCVTMANDYLLDLHQQIDIARTRVVLTNQVQWLDSQEVNVRRERFAKLFKQYQKAWLQNNIVELTTIYSNDALPPALRFANDATTRKVVASDAPIEKRLSPTGINLAELENLHLSDISLVMNPKMNTADATQYLLMEFEVGEQAARSRVMLYWEQNAAGFWQIKREAIHADGA